MTAGENVPELSVIICTYNRVNELTDCLSSLLQQTLDKTKYEVIIVDNNSKDNTASVISEYIQKYSMLKYIFEPTQGLSHARNTGWRNACGSFVAFIDDDAIAGTNWASSILRDFIEVKPCPDSVGGPIESIFEKNPSKWFPVDFFNRQWNENAEFLNSDTFGVGFFGGNVAYRKEVLENYGGFSPDFGMSGNSIGLGEETFLNCLLKRDGGLFYNDPDVCVKHKEGRDKVSIIYNLRRNYAHGKAKYLIDSYFGQLNSLYQCAGQLFYTLCKCCVYLLFIYSISGKRRFLQALLALSGCMGYSASLIKTRR